jgi:hypothetical protein
MKSTPSFACRSTTPRYEAAVDRHEIDAVLCLPFDDTEEIILRAVGDLSAPLRHLHDRLVDRDRPQRDGASLEDRAPDRIDVATGGEIHQRIGPRIDSGIEFLQLDPGIIVVGTRADIGIDLCAQAFPDPYDPAVSARISGDHGPAVSDESPELFGIDSFKLCDFLQCGTDLARPGLFDFSQAMLLSLSTQGHPIIIDRRHPCYHDFTDNQKFSMSEMWMSMPSRAILSPIPKLSATVPSLEEESRPNPTPSRKFQPVSFL